MYLFVKDHITNKYNRIITTYLMKLINFFLLIAAYSLSAQQKTDAGFNFPISQPYFESGKGPVVAIDDAHYNFHTLHGRFAALGKLLKNDGYMLQDFSSKLRRKKLDQVDVFVISNALSKRNGKGNWTLPTPSAFSGEEINELNQWVKDGGRLLLIADHMPMAGAIADLAASFGISFENAYALDQRKRPLEFFTKKDGTLLNNVVTSDQSPFKNVDSIVTFTGSAFKISQKSIPVLILDKQYKLVYPDTASKFHETTRSISGEGFYQLALMEYGKGKIVVSGEAAMFSAQLAGPHKKKLGFNNPGAHQNCQLILNLFHWLTEKK